MYRRGERGGTGCVGKQGRHKKNALPDLGAWKLNSPLKLETLLFFLLSSLASPPSSCAWASGCAWGLGPLPWLSWLLPPAWPGLRARFFSRFFSSSTFSAAQQLDERLLGAVALLPCSADDAQIAAVTIAKNRGAIVSNSLPHGVLCHQVGAPPDERAARSPRFAERDQSSPRADAWLSPWESSSQSALSIISEVTRFRSKRPPMSGVPSKFPSSYFVTHGIRPSVSQFSVCQFLSWQHPVARFHFPNGGSQKFAGP